MPLKLRLISFNPTFSLPFRMIVSSKLFGFGWEGVDYDADVNPEINFDVISL